LALQFYYDTDPDGFDALYELSEKYGSDSDKGKNLNQIQSIFMGLILPSATLHFVGWVELISGYVGFRFTQPNLHVVSSIAQCETQQWPILEPSPNLFITFISRHPILPHHLLLLGDIP
jgi:hypothetical protein